MKKLLLLFITLFSIGITCFSQVYFSCYYREYCDWDSRKSVFVNCSGYDENSLFFMNKEETMFTHTTESMKSAYYINNYEYDSENDVYTYNVTSDAGNKYYYVFDLNNKQIRILITKGENIQLLRFYVKNYWTEE